MPSAVALLLLLLLLLLQPPAASSNLNFFFPYFTTNEHSLTFSANSNVEELALQVTANSGSINVANSSGQITHVSPFSLWRGSRTASFSTSFVLNIGFIGNGGTNGTGGGMTFMLSSVPAVNYLANSFGQWLGLADGKSPAQHAKVFAIEFDTFKDSFDPDANHIGIDVDANVNSTLAKSLDPYGVTLVSRQMLGINTSVWIDYDGTSSTLDVYIANQYNLSERPARPAHPVISGYVIDLRKHLPESVYVGFSASLGTQLQTHCLLEWHFQSSDLAPTSLTFVIVAATIASFLAFVMVLLLLRTVVLKCKQKEKKRIAKEDLSRLCRKPQNFAYRQLERATKGFSDEYLLGRGGFGAVYKGEMKSIDGSIIKVAVKLQQSDNGEEAFKTEIKSMGGISHRNLVQLLGWSYRKDRLILVYEYMANKSLDQWILKGQRGMEVMDWERRFHIMKGIAAGLLYLHEGWEMVVIHRDLKPSNVMLDADFNARIGDFGLAKLMETKQKDPHVTQNNAGTYKYMAPEQLNSKIVSKETDIYSLGVIAIELVTGHCVPGHIEHIATLLQSHASVQEFADPELTKYDPVELQLLLHVGIACCQYDPAARPTIRNIVLALDTLSTTPLAAVPSSLPAEIITNTKTPNCTETSTVDIELSAAR